MPRSPMSPMPLVERVRPFQRAAAVLLTAALIAVTGASGPPSADAGIQPAAVFVEGADFALDRRLAPDGSPFTLSWNLWDGAENLPYYVHTDVVAAGLLTPIQNALATWASAPGSRVSFTYRGVTTVTSNIVRDPVTGQFGNPNDGVSVVSFGNLGSDSAGSEIAGRAGMLGPLALSSDGTVTGSGTPEFDLTLSATSALAIGAQPNRVDVETLVLHEIGHALGLTHPTQRTTSVMWEQLPVGTTKRVLDPADIHALALLYPEPASTNVCEGKPVTVEIGLNQVPTDGDDVIWGTPGDDVINGLGGNDVICSLGGDDVVDAGPGDDEVFGGEGNDQLVGGEGRDRMRGQNGNDRLDGGPGNDNLNGNNGDDRVNGGEGNDYVSGRDGKDIVTGGDGNDIVYGGGKSDVIKGGNGIDRIYGNAFADTIYGGQKKDTIYGGDGNDIIDAQEGNDIIEGGRGDDTIDGGIGTDTCDGRDGTDTAVNCEVTLNLS